jgi:hypothetical protein
MLRTPRPGAHDVPAAARHPERDAAATSRRERLLADRGARAHHRGRLALAVVAAAATALLTAATARDVAPRAPTAADTTVRDRASVADQDDVATSAAIDDAEAWCDHVSSYYLAFPSPWSARVVNCRSTDLSVAPVHADDSLGSCVVVPARHSRHLGGDIVRWVTDVRLC